MPVKPYIETKAILRKKWFEQEDRFIAEGWGFVKMENGIVYLQRVGYQ